MPGLKDIRNSHEESSSCIERGSLTSTSFHGEGLTLSTWLWVGVQLSRHDSCEMPDGEEEEKDEEVVASL